jgi:hypothetical protein
VVAPDDLHRPAAVTDQEEDDVARRARLVVAPIVHVGVEDEVTLRAPGRPARVRGAQGVVALVGAHARDDANAVGAERGHDVVGAAVVERVGVRGDRRPHAFGHRREARRVCAHQKPRSTIGRSNG